MFFYHIIRVIIVSIIWPITGRINYLNRDRLPKDENYVLVGPHRTWWDPVWYALAAFPKQFIYMAKQELFKHWALRKLITALGAFPVDRQKVGMETIRYPINELKNGQRSLIMFPSGSRHSQSLKSGSLVIAKLAKKPIVPAVYQGPVKFSHLFKRNNTTINFGQPIYIDPKVKLTDETIEAYNEQILAAFQALDAEIDPDWVYHDPKANKK
ncbi:1-acyl-sn-glycerol-3-phosphate acyltransferase [Leuconostocaceae bacterium ESL0958]|nr:1-acyl-sn-glycerol-3-phosphate acyltransferase [Leuconostocaceae bacterium ESL0958]